MSERNYYVIRDDNCKFPSMTKEQIIEAIAEATGMTPQHIDDAFITKIKEFNHNDPLKFWVGTQAQYNAITPTNGVLYILTDADPLAEIIVDVDDLKNGVGTAVDYPVEISENTGWKITKWHSGKVEARKEIDALKSDFTISQVGDLYKYRYRMLPPPLTQPANLIFNVMLHDYALSDYNTENMWVGNVQNAETHLDINFFGIEDLITAKLYSFTLICTSTI